MKPKYAIFVIERGDTILLATRNTSEGAEKAYEEIKREWPGAQIRMLMDGEWVRCDE